VGIAGACPYGFRSSPLRVPGQGVALNTGRASHSGTSRRVEKIHSAPVKVVGQWSNPAGATFATPDSR
jgi:hypothetical protein